MEEYDEDEEEGRGRGVGAGGAGGGRVNWECYRCYNVCSQQFSS